MGVGRRWAGTGPGSDGRPDRRADADRCPCDDRCPPGGDRRGDTLDSRMTGSGAQGGLVDRDGLQPGGAAPSGGVPAMDAPDRHSGRSDLDRLTRRRIDGRRRGDGISLNRSGLGLR